MLAFYQWNSIFMLYMSAFCMVGCITKIHVPFYYSGKEKKNANQGSLKCLSIQGCSTNGETQENQLLVLQSHRKSFWFAQSSFNSKSLDKTIHSLNVSCVFESMLKSNQKTVMTWWVYKNGLLFQTYFKVSYLRLDAIFCLLLPLVEVLKKKKKFIWIFFFFFLLLVNSWVSFSSSLSPGACLLGFCSNIGESFPYTIKYIKAAAVNWCCMNKNEQNWIK